MSTQQQQQQQQQQSQQNRTQSGNGNESTINNGKQSENTVKTSQIGQQSIQKATLPSISPIIINVLLILSDTTCKPLWNYEDITAKVWTIKSAEKLSCFLQHIINIFSYSYPKARIVERWGQTALQMGLSSSSRHYAGRCLQIFRALNLPINSRMLSEILSRLIETVAEHGEDMQGYVTEILLTLEAAVDSLDSDFHPLDVTKDFFKSTPNLNNKDGSSSTGSGALLCGIGGAGGGGRKGNVVTPSSAKTPHICLPNHARSTSYTISYCASRKLNTTSCDKHTEMRRNDLINDMEKNMTKLSGSALSRSKSAQSLKMLSDTTAQDDKMTILAQLFWLSVSLLESDYEHEFLFAIRLLTRVLYRLPLDRPDAREKVEKLLQQLKWTSYPGVHALLMKGCTHSSTYEPTITLLSQITPLLNLSVCDPTQSCAFPMNVISLLPYMLLHFEEANDICIRSAQNIAQVSSELGAKLENLGTVMTLYSRKTFCKESFQWTKCVVKYLHDTYAHLSLHMLAFLIEVLEKGPQQVQVPILNVIHCMLYYVDLSTPQAQAINNDLFRVVGKYIETINWKDALKILKLIVTRSSSLQVVPPNNENSTGQSAPFHGSTYTDSDLMNKKELAGRTMDFNFDVSQTPLIGRHILCKSDGSKEEHHSTITSTNSTITTTLSSSLTVVNVDATQEAFQTRNPNSSNNQTQQQQFSSYCNLQQMSNSNGGTSCGIGNNSSNIRTPSSPRRSASLSPADVIPPSSWKRPWISQSRVRECLVNLLAACGQRVGLPKSPSVIFSQTSDILERQSSVASSTEDTSGPQGDLSSGSRRDDGQPDFTVFKEFDFLEYEDSIAGESTDNFNWGVRRHQLFDGKDDSLLCGLGRSSVKGGHSPSLEDSFSDKTPILSKRHRQAVDDSSDEEAESESPIDEDRRLFSFVKLGLNINPPLSLNLQGRSRRNSVSHSDTSGSSVSDLGDITPCNVSPHLPRILRFRTTLCDEIDEAWRRQIQKMLVIQTTEHVSDLLMQLHYLIKELTFKTINISKNTKQFFTGISSELGDRISAFLEMLSLKVEPPQVWCNPLRVNTPRLIETLRFNILEIQEHLETFFDRKDHVLECLDAVKASCRLSLFKEADVANSSIDLTAVMNLDNMPFDFSSAELILDLGRSIYKLMFQLLLLIESNHKICSNVINHLRHNENMHDVSDLYILIKDALFLSLSETNGSEAETGSKLFEGDHTPTPSPDLPISNDEFLTTLSELIDSRRWSEAITHVRCNRRISQLHAPNPYLSLSSVNILDYSQEFDEISIILNIYALNVLKTKTETFIVSKSNSELFEVYAILSENLYRVSNALTTMETDIKNYSNGILTNTMTAGMEYCDETTTDVVANL